MFADLRLKREALKDIVEKRHKAYCEARGRRLGQTDARIEPEGSLPDSEPHPFRLPLRAATRQRLVCDLGNPGYCRRVTGLRTLEDDQDIAAQRPPMEPQECASGVLRPGTDQAAQRKMTTVHP